MYEHHPSTTYQNWPRPFTQEQLGQAVTQATVAHAVAHEAFTTRELFVDLQEQHLLPPTTDFAAHFRQSIQPAVLTTAEEQGGLAEWHHQPGNVGNRYSLTLYMPDAPVAPQPEAPAQQPAPELTPVEAASNPQKPDITIARLVLDAIRDHKHPDQYIHQSSLFASLKEQSGVDPEQAKSTLAALGRFGLVDIFKKSSRKHGGAFIAVGWSDPKISRTWRLHEETVIKYLSNPNNEGNTFVPTPLNRRERRSRHGRGAKNGRSKQK